MSESYPIPSSNQFINRVGQRFGRLLVTGYAGKRSGQHSWFCLCECGETKTAHGCHLHNGDTKSCGCLQIERATAAVTTHGKSYSRSMHVWGGMIQRCDNPKNPCFVRWGGRGIAVCDRWRKFENFYDDMGEAPKGLSLDRIDNNGNYEPSNCRWASLKTQGRNQRKNRIVEFNGKRQCLSAWSEELGISSSTLFCRLKRGSIERALTTPLRADRRRTG